MGFKPRKGAGWQTLPYYSDVADSPIFYFIRLIDGADLFIDVCPVGEHDGGLEWKVQINGELDTYQERGPFKTADEAKEEGLRMAAGWLDERTHWLLLSRAGPPAV